MDARTVLAAWLDENNPDRRGKQGRLLQGTSPERYGEHVKDWIAFIEGLKIGAWHARPSHFVTWLDARGGRARTRALRVSAVGAFYAYAQHFGHTKTTPVDPKMGTGAWSAPRTQKLTPGQMELLRWGADHLVGGFAERDRLFAYLQLGGLRSRQITEFDLRGLHYEQQRTTADIWQKGGGTRRYVLPEEIVGAIHAYLPVRTFQPPRSYEHSGPLLLSYRGNQLDSNMTPREIWQRVLLAALTCEDPDAPELPARITPDMVALSPSPFGELQRA